MTRSPGAWPRKSSSVHRKRRESTTAEGPCTPSGCQRAVGSGRYRSPSSRYLYRVPGATLAMVRVKTSSAPRVIGWGRRPSIATSTDRHRGAQTAKVTVSSRTLAASTFIRSNEPTYGLGLRAGLAHPPPDGAESRPVASRQRLALRSRVRRLPPPARPRRFDPPPAPLRRRNAPPPLRPGASRHLAPRVRVSAALRVDPADRARQWPRPEGQTRHRGIARQARARVLRGGRAPRIGRRSRLSLPRLRAVQGGTRRARHVGAWDRGSLALRVVSGRVARRQRDGGRVLPRPEDHAPGLEPRARLSGGLRVPRVPQEAFPRRAALLAHHRQLRRPRP